MQALVYVETSYIGIIMYNEVIRLTILQIH